MRSNGNQKFRPACVALGRAVRLRRKELALSQLDLCALAGVGPAFLYSLESGKPTLRLDKVFEVLHVLGLELHIRVGKELVSTNEQLTRGVK